MTLSRRFLLQAMALAGMPAALITRAARAATPENAMASSYAPFDGPFNARFSGELRSPPIRVEGRLPAPLRGTLYRNGPARMRLGATAYRHWFDGDGMVQAFTLADGQVQHHGLLLRTPKLMEEEAAGRFLYPAFGTTFAGAHDVHGPDSINPANVNLLAMKDGRELYALWEAGSALEIDPRTLAARGFKAWSSETAGAPFSAHPRVAPDGTVWSFGYMAGTDKLIIYEIAPEGHLRRQTMLDQPQTDMVHDFAITPRYLVFLLMPLKFDRQSRGSVAFADRFRWDGDAPMTALVVDKSDFSARRFELPNGGVFHLGNAWEEGGTIRVGYVRHGDMVETLKRLRVVEGPRQQTRALTAWANVTIDLAAGRATQHVQANTAEIEFPRFDARRTGQKTALTILAQRSASMPAPSHGFDTVIALDGQGRIDRFAYGEGWLVEEHIHVPRPGSADEADGWVMGTAYDWRKQRTTLSVFDARCLAAGPIARARLPYGLPIGLHGLFVPAVS